MIRSWILKLGVLALGLGVLGLAIGSLAWLAGVTQASHQYPDVPDGAWYHDDVGWLTDNNIAVGFPDGTYRPNNDVTRAEIATLLHRTADATKPDPVAVSANYAVAWNSDDTKMVTVLCPAGTKVSGGGGSLTGFTAALVNVALQNSYPLSDLSGWHAQAHEINATATDWNLTVRAVCIKG